MVVSILAYNLTTVLNRCFRCWEFWSLGEQEISLDILLNSETPNLPAAKAIIKIILIYTLVRKASGELHSSFFLFNALAADGVAALVFRRDVAVFGALYPDDRFRTREAVPEDREA